MTDQPTGNLDQIDGDVEIAEPDLTEPDETVHPALDVEDAELDEPDGKDAP